MGHIVDADREYRLLQRTLDHKITGAPESPTFTKILKLLWSPEEAELARRLPSTPQPLDVLARKLGMPEDQLGDKLTEMAQRGIVVDLQIKGKRYFALPPVVIGFFEYTFMRARDDMPMAELAGRSHRSPRLGEGQPYRSIGVGLECRTLSMPP